MWIGGHIGVQVRLDAMQSTKQKQSVDNSVMLIIPVLWACNEHLKTFYKGCIFFFCSMTFFKALAENLPTVKSKCGRDMFGVFKVPFPVSLVGCRQMLSFLSKCSASLFFFGNCEGYKICFLLCYVVNTR